MKLRTRLGIFQLFLLFSSLFFLVPKAQANYEPASSPLVYVQHIVLNTSSYKAGAMVTGSFILANQHPETVSNVVYKISLAGDYGQSGLAQTIYDTKVFNNPLFLDSNEQKKISFSYQLPLGVSGTHLGIQIQAMLASGQPLSWADSFIDVSGAHNFVTIAEASIETNNIAYSLEAGPTVSKGNEVFLYVGLSNPTGHVLNLTPVIAMYQGSVDGNPLATSTEGIVSLGSKKISTIKIALPTFNYTPGVYVGVINFVDDTGVTGAPPLQFRYIIEGPIVTIRSISADEQYATLNEPLSVTVNYTGTPYDIASGTLGASTTQNIADLNLSVFNENNELVGSTTRSIDFNQGTSQTFSLIPGHAGNSLHAIVTVTKNGNVVSSYATSLSGSQSALYATQHVEALAATTRSKNTIFIALSIFILVSLSLFCWLFFRIRSHKTSRLIIIFLSTSIACSSILIRHVLANYTQTAQTNYLHSTIINQDNIIINPLNQTTGTDTLSPGQSFSVTGSATVPACTNGLERVKYYMSDPYETSSYSSSQAYSYTTTDNNNPKPCGDGIDCSQGEGNYTNHDQFSLGTYTAPTTPGHYLINVQLKNIINRTDDQYYSNNSLPQCDVDNFAVSTAYPTNDNGEAASNQCPVNYLNNTNQGYIEFDVVSPQLPPVCAASGYSSAFGAYSHVENGGSGTASMTDDGGGNVTLTNEFGSAVAGSISDHTITAYGWGNLEGTINSDYTQIAWANNTAWDRDPNPDGCQTQPVVNLYATLPNQTPTQSQVSISQGSSLNLTWDSSNIQSGTCSAISGEGFSGSLSDTSSALGLAVSPSSDQLYQLACQDLQGVTVYSNKINVVVNALPNTPTNLTATPGSCDSNTINLSWDAVPDATGYYVYDNGAQIGNVVVANFSDPYLTPSSNHSYTVIAYNATGRSSQSGAVTATAPAACTISCSTSGSSSSSNSASEITGRNAAYTFDETDGTIAHDSSGNGYDAAVNGSNPTWVPGKFGNALQFNGVDNYVFTGGSINGGDNTISMWVKETSRVSNDGNPANAHMLYFASHYYNELSSSNGKLCYAIDGTATLGNSNYGWSCTGATIPLNTWTHLVFVIKSGNYFKIYENGVEVYSATNSAYSQGVLPLYIGSWQSSIGFFDGDIDEVNIYNKALSADDVANLYSAYTTPINSCQNQSTETCVAYRSDGVTPITGAILPNTEVIWKADEPGTWSGDGPDGTSLTDPLPTGDSYPITYTLPTGDRTMSITTDDGETTECTPAPLRVINVSYKEQ